MLIAGALSRAYGQAPAASRTTFEMHLEAVNAEDILEVPAQPERLRKETKLDETLQAVMQ